VSDFSPVLKFACLSAAADVLLAKFSLKTVVKEFPKAFGTNPGEAICISWDKKDERVAEILDDLRTPPKFDQRSLFDELKSNNVILEKQVESAYVEIKYSELVDLYWEKYSKLPKKREGALLLNQMDLFAIALYTSDRGKGRYRARILNNDQSIYSVVNRIFLLFEGDNDSKGKGLELYHKWRIFSKHLYQGIRHLPGYHGDLYRGVKTFQELTVGKTFKTSQFLSTSKDPMVAKGFAGNDGILLQIVESGQIGADLAEYSFFEIEREVLFNPFHFFEVLEIKNEGSRKTITLRFQSRPNQESAKAQLFYECQLGNTGYFYGYDYDLKLLHAMNFLGQTLLYVGAFHGHIEIVNFLLNQPNANVDATNQDGSTAAHGAAVGNQIAILELLIRRSANLRIKNNDRKKAKDLNPAALNLAFENLRKNTKLFQWFGFYLKEMWSNF